MKFRKLKNYEKDFIKLNNEIIEIIYYSKFAKNHRVEPSNFKIVKGYAFIFSKKLQRAFNKVQFIDVIEHRTDGRPDKHYKNLRECLGRP